LEGVFIYQTNVKAVPIYYEKLIYY